MITRDAIVVAKAQAEAAVAALVRILEEHRNEADLDFLEGLCWQATTKLRWVREREAEKGGAR